MEVKKYSNDLETGTEVYTLSRTKQWNINQLKMSCSPERNIKLIESCSGWTTLISTNTCWGPVMFCYFLALLSFLVQVGVVATDGMEVRQCGFEGKKLRVCMSEGLVDEA